jgi:O-antigen ligase
MNTSTLPFSPSSRIFAILLGISIPSLAYGRVVFAVIVGMAFVTLIISRPFRDVICDLSEQIKTPIGILILLTYIAWLPSVFFSNFPLRSFEAVTRTLLFIGIASMFWSCLRLDQRLIAISSRAFLFMTIASTVFTLLSMTVLPEFFWAMRLKGWLTEPIGSSLKGFSSLAVFIVPLLIIIGYHSTRMWQVACVGLSAAFAFIVWENFNRATIAGFLAAGLIVTLALLVSKVSKKIAYSAMLVMGVAIYAALTWLESARGYSVKLFGSQEDWLLPIWLIDFERQKIWTKAWEIASGSPWFGIGANTINFAPGADEIIKGTHGLHIIPAHPHNWLVEVLAETGAVGLAALSITILLAAVWFLLNLRQTGNIGTMCAIGIMAGYWGSGLFNFSYWSAWWQLSFLISIAICFAFNSLTDKAATP